MNTANKLKCLGIASLAFLCLAGQNVRADQSEAGPAILSPNSHPYGRTYGQWSAAWWTWAMQLPLVSSTGITHPFYDDPRFNVAEGQTGKVWFLAAPFGTVTRSVTIPGDKALFVAILTAEGSDLEGYGTTAAEQRAGAKAQADAIVMSSLFATLDGVPVSNLASYHAVSPQFGFNAPTPWIFGDVGGRGKSVGDGYYLMLAPLSAGQHTLHFGGMFDFGPGAVYPLDMTYQISVQPKSGAGDDDQQD